MQYCLDDYISINYREEISKTKNTTKLNVSKKREEVKREDDKRNIATLAMRQARRTAERHEGDGRRTEITPTTHGG